MPPKKVRYIGMTNSKNVSTTIELKNQIMYKHEGDVQVSALTTVCVMYHPLFKIKTAL